MAAPIGNQAGPHEYPEWRRAKGSAFDFELLPQQWEFFQCKQPEAMYSGAFGAGKTRVLCIVAAALAVNPKARVALVRKTLVSLRQTTLKTLLEQDGDLPAVLPEGSYEFRRVPGELEIKLNGGGVILPIGCDNHESIASLNVSDICIDEATELDPDEYNMLLGRARIAYTELDENGNETKHVPKIRMATNPGSPGHHLYKRFFKDPPKSRIVFHGSTLDNPFLPETYINTVNSFTGMYRRRYVLGEWVAAEGAIFPMFSMDKHVRHIDGPFDYFVAGVDVGFTHKSVIRVFGVYGDRQRHCVAEYYKSGGTIDELVDGAKEADKYYCPCTFVCDASAALAIEALKQAGIRVKPAQRDWHYGIKLLENALTAEVEGVPKLTFEPGLQGTPEYLDYRWKPNSLKEQPIKEKDDAVDADRYAMMEIDYGRSGKIGGFVSLSSGESRDDERWRQGRRSDRSALAGDALRRYVQDHMFNG